MIPVLRKARLVYGMLDWRKLAVRFERCPACGPTLFVRLNETDWGVRCIRCGGAPNTLSLVAVLQEVCPRLGDKDVYALTSYGPLFDYLSKRCGQLVCSFYDDDVRRGEYRNGVQCQDVQQLTFDDEAFDLCIHSEVFEHVADDRQGFREIHRVLKKGGGNGIHCARVRPG